MTKRFLSTIRITNLSSDPATGSAGEIYFNTGSAKFKYYNGSAWTEFSSGGASVSDTAPSSPTTGQIWYNSSDLNTYIYYDSSWVQISGGASTASIYVGETPDVSPQSGDLWFNSSNAKTYIYYDSTWVEIGGSDVGVSSLSGTAGQINVSASVGAVTVSLADSGASAGTYGSSALIPAITVDSKGRITSVSTNAVQGLPSQTGNSGKYLTTDGTTASWATVEAGLNPFFLGGM